MRAHLIAFNPTTGIDEPAVEVAIPYDRPGTPKDPTFVPAMDAAKIAWGLKNAYLGNFFTPVTGLQLDEEAAAFLGASEEVKALIKAETDVYRDPGYLSSYPAIARHGLPRSLRDMPISVVPVSPVDKDAEAKALEFKRQAVAEARAEIEAEALKAKLEADAKHVDKPAADLAKPPAAKP